MKENRNNFIYEQYEKLPKTFLFGIGSIASAAITQGLSSFLYYVFATLGKLIELMMTLLNFAIYAPATADIPVVIATWKILRDFSNMLFIVVLVWMAFGTIFDLRNYKFSDMISRFLMVAILINFSYVLGEMVINATQLLNNVFLASIGDIGARLGQYLSPQQVILAVTGAPSSTTGALANVDLGLTSIVGLIAGIVLFGIILFSTLIAVLFSFIRIPIIWVLLMISPMAWMANILPGTQKRFQQWWGLFLGWNLFLPVYLFFMYLGLYFLSKQGEIVAAVAGSQGTAPIPGMGSLTFSIFFFYLFAGFLLVGGAATAVSVTSSMSGSKAFASGFNMAKGWVKKLPPFSTAEGLSIAAKNRYEEYMKQPGMTAFNAQKQASMFNRYAPGLRTDRAQATFLKDFTTGAKKQYDTLSEEYDTGELSIEQLRERASSTSAATPQGYAYRKLAIQKGIMKDDQFRDALIGLQSNPYAVQDLIKTAKDSKFAGIENLKGIALDKRLSGPNFVSVKRELLDHIANDPKKASGMNREDINEAVEVLGKKESPEAQKFLKDLSKVRPDLVYQFQRENDMLKQPAEDATGKKSTMTTQYGAVRDSLNTEPKNIANMPDDLWKSEVFKAALKEKLYGSPLPGAPKPSTKARNNLRSSIERFLVENGADDKLTVLNDVAPKNDFQDQPQGRRNNRPGGPQNPPQPPPTGGAGTISYHETDINPNNVIDLRQKRDYNIE